MKLTRLRRVYDLLTSLPLWERGLKLGEYSAFSALKVAPLVGAWIEISVYPTEDMYYVVAPLVGAWIEI